MFAGAKEFNQDLDKWETSSLANINQTFWDTTSFNGNITTWDVSKVYTILLQTQCHSTKIFLIKLSLILLQWKEHLVDRAK
ncbi:Prolipoprotein [Mycoplasma capricolum subsp. capricolum]|nr:Prolipoprotein [Mycoplasma capricolum subsp. capricolum]